MGSPSLTEGLDIGMIYASPVDSHGAGTRLGCGAVACSENDMRENTDEGTEQGMRDIRPPL